MTCKICSIASCLLLAASYALQCSSACSAGEDPFMAPDILPSSCLSCYGEAWSWCVPQSDTNFLSTP